MPEQITTKPFVSKRQQRMAFARGLPFARRWAKQTDFAALPEHKDAGTVAGASLHGPGGLLATPGLGTTRKPRKGRKWGMKLKDGYGARTGETIRGNLGRSNSGQFQRVGTANPDAPPAFGRGAPKKPRKGKGRKGRASAKPKQTPEQRQAARTAEHAQNQAKVLSGLGIDATGQAALDALRGGQQPDPKAIENGKFEQSGLVEQAQDGSYRMTASGRAALSAAQAGDAGRAQSIISSARDRTGARQQRQTASATRQQASATRRAQVQARRDASAAKRAAKLSAKKPAKAGGGGGSKKPKPAPKPAAASPAKPAPKPSATPSHAPFVPQAPKPPPKPTKEQTTASNQAAVRNAMAQADQGLAPGGFDNLIALGGGKEPDGSGAQGLIGMGMAERGSDGTLRLTSAGRATIAAANRGDAKAAIDTISRASEPAKARTKTAGSPGDYLIAEDPKLSSTWHLQVKRNGKIDHSLMGSAWAALHSGFRGNVYQGPHKTEAITKLKRLYAAEKMPVPSEKSFIVFKDAKGRDRWVARTTTAYQDRDGEIISEAALDQDSQRMTASKTFGPLRWWHVGDPDPLAPSAPWGPGLDLGDCDYSTVIGRTRVESGTFHDADIARKVAARADDLEMSPGFFHPLDQPDRAGVFHTIRTFERSVVPVRYGRASNLFTGFAVKEFTMDIAEMEKRFKAAIVDLGLSAEQAQAFGAQLVQTEKAAQAQGIAYKDAAVEELEYPDLEINGIIYKAAPPMASALPMDAEDDPALGGDSGVDEAAEGEPPMDGQTEGDYIGDMSVDDFKAMLSELLAPVLKMQDMVKSIGDAHAELKGMYGGVATKDDARNQELIALKAQYAELAQKIATIEGDQPAVILPDEVASALKSAGPSQAQPPDDPAKLAALSDPSRPLAWLGMQTFPELYQNGENT